MLPPITKLLGPGAPRSLTNCLHSLIANSMILFSFSHLIQKSRWGHDVNTVTCRIVANCLLEVLSCSGVRFACINLKFPNALHTVITLINRCQHLHSITELGERVYPASCDHGRLCVRACVCVCFNWTVPQTRPCSCRRTAGSSLRQHRCCWWRGCSPWGYCHLEETDTQTHTSPFRMDGTNQTWAKSSTF